MRVMSLFLENDVPVPRGTSELFDAKDKIGASKAIVANRTAWADRTGTLLAGAWEVFDTSKYGTNFTVPIGEDIDTDSTGSITELFEYVGLTISASEDGTSIDIDSDGDGTIDTTVSLNEGETHFVDGGIQSGATVNATKPIQAHLITGNVSEDPPSTFFASRWYTLYPDEQWSNTYYSPVGNANSVPTNVFIYNPNGSQITVNYDYRDNTNTLVSGSFNVPAGSTTVPAVARHVLESGSGYRFYTNNAAEKFAAISTVSSPENAARTISGVEINSIYDWGHNLISDSNLNPVIVIGYAPGSDDLINNDTGAVTPDGEPDQASYSPVWITPVAATRVYVNYSGDLSQGTQTDPNGNKYDEHYDLEELESVKIFDSSDGDMTGARIYTTDGTNISGAWGQDPDTAGLGSPAIDVGTAILPLPIAYASKTAELEIDNANLQVVDPGDTLEYTINVRNDGVVILGNVNVNDTIPQGTTYVPGSSTVDGVAIGDDTSGTPFPFDDDGIFNGFDDGRNVGNIEVDGTLDVTYDLLINDPYDGPLEGITNSATIDSDEETLNIAVTTQVEIPTATKTLYLSDTNDLDRIDPANSDPVDSTSSQSSFSAALSDFFVGVDFDATTDGTASPNNWSATGYADTTLTNLIDEENGTGTGINLALDFLGTGGTDTGNTSTVPTHTNDLSLITNNVWDQTGLTATWSGLQSNANYEIYVFGLDRFADNQNVTITGDGTNDANFGQNFNANQLFVNDVVASTANLDTFATIVTSTATGNITVNIDEVNGYIGVAGLAISPLLQAMIVSLLISLSRCNLISRCLLAIQLPLLLT